MPLEAQVKRIVIEQLRLDRSDVEREDSFSNLGADSLDLAELLMRVEQTFELRIPADSARELRSVGSLIDYVASVATR
ncbi:MAG: Acyl carrier protein [Pseudomonadota bacterium]